MELPFCHSRRRLDGKPHVFFCAHPLMHAPGGLVTAGNCALCGYWKEPAPQTFRTTAPPLDNRVPTSCRFLGETIGLRDCPSCQGSVRVKVFACGHPNHGQTTLAECLVCPDFQAGAKGPSLPAASEISHRGHREHREKTHSMPADGARLAPLR